MRRGFLSISKPPPPPPSPPPQSSAPDRLSSLQDDILISIISLLCTDEMVRTGILSRRWRRLWTRSPILHFTQNFSLSTAETLDINNYPSVADLCISHCSSNSKLVSARFPISIHPTPTSTADADRWIRFSAARSVERLAFSASCRTPRVPMPPSLFECRSLTELRLNACSLPSAAPAGCFPSLCTIVLTAVDVSDDSMEALLKSALRLESLSLTMLSGITRLIIRAFNMRHLMVYDCGCLQRLEVVEAPELRRLMYMGDVSKIGNLEGKVPWLDEVALLSTERVPFKNNPISWKCLVRAVAHARVLTVNNWILKWKYCLKGVAPGDQQVVFKNLKELHWWPVYQKTPGAPAEPWSADKISTASLHGLLSVLRDCPSLEKLCIRATYLMEQEDDYLFLNHEDEYVLLHMSYYPLGRNFDQLAPLKINSVDYELPCLKMVNITEFSGSKFEMRLLKFLIEKAAALESVTLHYVEDVKQELGVIRRQLTTPSSHACITIAEFDDDEVCPKHEYMWYKYMIW